MGIGGAVSAGVKRSGREANHSPPSNAEIRMNGAIGAIHSLPVRNLYNTNQYTILYFIHTIFYIAATCFGVISLHLQGADTKVCIKLTAIN
jgi:hypothetical protein